jgi:hypothetical protein
MIRVVNEWAGAGGQLFCLLRSLLLLLLLLLLLRLLPCLRVADRSLARSLLACMHARMNE